jgi:hypothetical protein
MKPSPSQPVDAMSWLAFAFAYLLAYFLSTVIPTALLWYYPLLHRFQWQVRSNGLAMDFYGRLLLCLLCGFAGMLLLRLLRGPLRSLGEVRTTHGLLVWVAGLFLFTGGLHVSLLLHRDPRPVPLPPGYVPR